MRRADGLGNGTGNAEEIVRDLIALLREELGLAGKDATGKGLEV
jgi:hypothetical protein